MVVSDLSVLALTVRRSVPPPGRAVWCWLTCGGRWSAPPVARAWPRRCGWPAALDGGGLAVTLLQLRGDRPRDRAIAVATASRGALRRSPGPRHPNARRTSRSFQARQGPPGMFDGVRGDSRGASFVAALVPSAGLRTRLVASLSFASLVVHGIGWASLLMCAAAVSELTQATRHRIGTLCPQRTVLVAILIAMIGLTIVLPPGPIRLGGRLRFSAVSRSCRRCRRPRSRPSAIRRFGAQCQLDNRRGRRGLVARRRARAGFPLGLPAMAGTMAAAAIMLGLTHAVPGIGRSSIASSRRPDYRAAARICQRMRRSPNRRTNSSLAERHVHAVLGLPASPSRRIPRRGERLPIGGRSVLEVRRSPVGRGLMRDELVYLEGVATEVSHRLDSWRREQQRSLLLREERLRHSLTRPS